jgi:hypothetical protein
MTTMVYSTPTSTKTATRWTTVSTNTFKMTARRELRSRCRSGGWFTSHGRKQPEEVLDRRDGQANDWLLVVHADGEPEPQGSDLKYTRMEEFDHIDESHYVDMEDTMIEASRSFGTQM